MIPLKDDIPTRRFPILTVALIAINIAVFFAFQGAQLSFSGTQIDHQKTVEYGLIPYELTNPGKRCGIVRERVQTVQGLAARERVACEGQPGVTGEAPAPLPVWMTLFTAMFMHGGILHLAGNMLFLWIFGNNIEDSMSRWRFALFYLLGGLIASFAQVGIDPQSTVPTIGASGAIAAVLGGYALLYPKARVTTLVIIIVFITVIQLPALLVLALWFLLQLLFATAELSQPLSGEGGGVAYFAHMGGFVAGLVLIKLFANRVHADYERAHRAPVY